jgi:MFS family permease
MYIPFMDNVNRLFQKRFCFTQVSAGSVITITYLITGAVSVPLGMLVDYIGKLVHYVGKRRYFIIATILVFTIAHFIILLYPQCL